MKRFWAGVLLLAWSGMALAVRPSEVRTQMEASMLVHGEVVVDEQGKVTRYELDRRDKLPDGVQRYVDATIAGWTFEPNLLDGKPVGIHNRMDLLLVARPIGDGDFRMELRSASFYPIQDAGYDIEQVTMTPPSYPRFAAENGVSGTAYLVVRLGADGSVVDAMAEQVNLRVARSEPEMKRWRELLARNAIEAARKWKFRLPVKGEHADAETWDVRVPVAYTLGEFGEDRERALSDAYGKWEAYMPGPRQPIPWRAGEDDLALESLRGGGLYPIGHDRDAGRLRLAAPTGTGGG